MNILDIPPQLLSLKDSLRSQDKCSSSHVCAVRLAYAVDIPECLEHERAKLIKNIILFQVIAHPVLRPLKIRHSNSSCIRKDVRDHKNIIFEQDFISFWSNRSVCQLKNYLCLYPWCILLCNHILKRSRNKNMRLQLKKLFICYLSCTKSFDRACLGLMLNELRYP